MSTNHSLAALVQGLSDGRTAMDRSVAKATAAAANPALMRSRLQRAKWSPSRHQNRPGCLPTLTDRQAKD